MMSIAPPDWRREAVDHRQAEAGALPTSLVVKNGSVTCSNMSGGNAAAAVRDGEHDIVAGAAARALVPAPPAALRPVTVIVPPCGIASRALMIRFISASSSWALSA